MSLKRSWGGINTNFQESVRTDNDNQHTTEH
jgi:hypothetical protein